MAYSKFSPCPKCKRRRIHVAEWYDNDGGSTYYCICDDCGYADPDRFEEEYVAIDHWNRRVSKGYLEGDATETDFDNLLVDESDYYEEPNYFDDEEDENEAALSSMGMHVVSRTKL